MNIARSSVKLTLASAGSAITTFGGIAYFARLLQPEQLGIFFLFEALLGILVIPADFGLRGAVEKRISEGKRPGAVLTTAVCLKLVPLTIVVGGVLLMSGYLNEYVGARIAHLLVFAIIGHEIYQLVVKVLRGELRVGETAELRLTERVAWVVVGILLIRNGFGVFGIIYAKIISFTLPAVWGLARKSTPFGRPLSEAGRSLYSYSKFNFISALSGYVYSWVDILAIGFFLTAGHVGVYETAWRVTAIGLLGSKAIAVSIFPQISNWDASATVRRIEQLIPQALTASLLIIIPAFFGTLLLAEEMMTFLFGAEYAAAWLVLIVLMGEKVFQSIHVITGRSLKAIDHPELAAKAALVAITLNLVLNAVLVWQFGIIGAAVATVAASLLNTSLCIAYLYRFLSFTVSWREIGWITASSAGMALFLFGITTVWSVNSLASLLLLISCSVVVYGLFILLHPLLRKRTLRSMSKITGWQLPSDVPESEN